MRREEAIATRIIIIHCHNHTLQISIIEWTGTSYQWFNNTDVNTIYNEKSQCHNTDNKHNLLPVLIVFYNHIKQRRIKWNPCVSRSHSQDEIVHKNIITPIKSE